MDRVLMFLVGVTFLAGGAYICKAGQEAKNMIETAMFGLLGIGVGVFLLICAFMGPPQ